MLAIVCIVGIVLMLLTLGRIRPWEIGWPVALVFQIACIVTMIVCGFGIYHYFTAVALA